MDLIGQVMESILGNEVLLEMMPYSDSENITRVMESCVLPLLIKLLGSEPDEVSVEKVAVEIFKNIVTLGKQNKYDILERIFNAIGSCI